MLSFQFTCLIRPIDQGPSHHSVAGFVACADAEPPVARSGKPGGEPARPPALVCRTTARFRPQCRRPRHHGQSRQPQVGSAPPHDQGRRRKALVLPPYPPDLNPIEQAFAKIKHWRRAAQRRTTEDAWRLLRQRRIRFRQNVKRSRVRPCGALASGLTARCCSSLSPDGFSSAMNCSHSSAVVNSAKCPKRTISW